MIRHTFPALQEIGGEEEQSRRDSVSECLRDVGTRSGSRGGGGGQHDPDGDRDNFVGGAGARQIWPKTRRDGHSSAATAAEASYYSGAADVFAAGASSTAAGSYPAAVSAVPLLQAWEPPVFQALLPLWEGPRQALERTTPSRQWKL